jgi:hypothetical protein
MNNLPQPNLADMQRACEKLAENHVAPDADGNYHIFADPNSIAGKTKLTTSAMIEKLPRKVRRKIARAQKKAIDHYLKTGEVVLPKHL